MYRSVRGAIADLDVLRSRSVRDATVEPFDGSRLLSIYLALLILIPSNLTVAVLGAAGSPANIFGVVLFVRWLVARVQGATPRGWTFLRGALVFYALAIMASYLAANLRPLMDLETNSADRGLIRLMSWSGVLLVTMDGLPTRQAFRKVVEVAAGGGVVLGLLGLLQATTSFNPADHVHIPGLRPLSLDKLAAPEIRNGLPRVYGTTSHPIEFATVLVLLIALTAPLALKEKPDKRSRWWFAGLAVMGITFPLAVARSGFLAIAALAIVVIPRLPRRARRRTLMGLPLGLVAVHSAFPGLLGTISGLFFSAADGSEYARTDDYPVVYQYFRDKPLFGRGVDTLLADVYRVLDNQVLLSLVQTGLVGLAAYLTLHVAAIRTAQRTRKIAVTADDRLLSQFLVGVPVAALVSSLTFDSLSFPMFAGLFFFAIGLTGAFSALVNGERLPARPDGVRAQSIRPKGSRTAQVVLAATCVIAAGAGLVWVKSTPVTWVNTSSTVVSPANLSAESRFAGTFNASRLSEILQRIMQSTDVRDHLRERGYRASYTIALQSGSLEPGTDNPGYGPLVQMQVQSHDPASTQATIEALMRELRSRLAQLQLDGGVDPSVQAVLSETYVPPSPVPEKAGGKRAYVAWLALVIGLYCTLRIFVRRIPTRRMRASRRSVERKRFLWSTADAAAD